jgi:transcriptional regulator with XRE-family HTH domain
MLPAELKEWRKRLGLTQEEAARRFGVSRVTEQNWESGTTAVPKTVDAATEIITAEWKRRPEFGPVWLVYSDRDNRHPEHGLARTAMMRRERFADNETALLRAMQMWGRKNFQDPFIQDEDGNSIWNLPRLRAEIERRRAASAPSNNADMADRLMEIGRHFSSLPVLDDRTDEEILGYDEFGLPH